MSLTPPIAGTGSLRQALKNAKGGDTIQFAAALNGQTIVLTSADDQTNTDPMLGPLQNNGGPIFTHELLLGSPAIDARDPNFTPPPWYDQRGVGYDRVYDGRIDIGSFEVQPCCPPTPSPIPGLGR